MNQIRDAVRQAKRVVIGVLCISTLLLTVGCASNGTPETTDEYSYDPMDSPYCTYTDPAAADPVEYAKLCLYTFTGWQDAVRRGETDLAYDDWFDQMMYG